MFIGVLSFSGSLVTMANVSNFTICMPRPTLKDLNPYEYNQILCCYPFMVNLDRCNRSCNTLGNLSNKICVPNKTEDLNLNAFNTVTRINESKTHKNIPCKCKSKFDGQKCNSNQSCNNNNCQCECQNSRKHVCKKDSLIFH